MRAYITKITKEYNKNGECYHICFRGTNPDKSYDAYIVLVFRNYQNWKKYIEAFLRGAQVWLDGLSITRDRSGREIVNADSNFFINRVVYPQAQIPLDKTEVI